jgi:hypothetical protein
MQEQKNKRLAILLLAVSCITAAVYLTTRGEGGLEVNKNLFKDYDLKGVTQIILESKNAKVDLKFNGTRWIVNDKFDADQSMIEVLFATLQQAEPKRPLPASVQDSVSNFLKENGVKVSVISSGKTETVFYGGGNAQKTQTFFYAESADARSYLMTIPGYRVYVAGIFELPEKGWKNKYVFGFNWRNFQSLETRFPQKPSDDFNVALQDDYFAVQGVAAVDTAKLNDYLDDVSLLTVDEYADGGNLTDSLAGSSPLMILTVKDIGQRSYTLALFTPSKDIQMVPGLINNAEWAFFDPRKIQNVLKTKAFFEK